MKKIIIATKNQGKAKEFKELYLKKGMEALSLLDIVQELPDVEETGVTFEENAALKAETIAELLQIPVLADDSGLVIDALDGRPGVYSARYAGEDKDDKANIKKVLEELIDVPEGKRTARFVCVLAIARPGEKTDFYKGTCEGSIAFEERGSNGFGYDPIFIPENETRTMAELSSEEKNSISHRSNAISKLQGRV
ncbi:XTP/dITP diphosphatase [Oceanobacillus piezotolerans]|uniref:dITP/XTP pyrophosphatase n=1 Tax=Oceanobacillus piezotolerans TaxID=2448030 RepID=A0A498DAD6_9BACI|nr:XTP/dITP diphosphatase [Oceanobacillus piezotolerans]RLL47941.1 XTP/dITP diphosphatase [Oceanobacillus piezotolerans]